MLILSVYICFVSYINNKLSVSALSIGGRYDITGFCLVTVLLEDPGVLFGTRRLIETRRLLVHNI